jgi:hypothetical protein
MKKAIDLIEALRYKLRCLAYRLTVRRIFSVTTRR